MKPINLKRVAYFIVIHDSLTKLKISLTLNSLNARNIDFSRQITPRMVMNEINLGN